MFFILVFLSLSLNDVDDLKKLDGRKDEKHDIAGKDPLIADNHKIENLNKPKDQQNPENPNARDGIHDKISDVPNKVNENGQIKQEGIINENDKPGMQKSITDKSKSDVLRGSVDGTDKNIKNENEIIKSGEIPGENQKANRLRGTTAYENDDLSVTGQNRENNIPKNNMNPHPVTESDEDVTSGRRNRRPGRDFPNGGIDPRFPDAIHAGTRHGETDEHGNVYCDDDDFYYEMHPEFHHHPHPHGPEFQDDPEFYHRRRENCIPRPTRTPTPSPLPTATPHPTPTPHPTATPHPTPTPLPLEDRCWDKCSVNGSCTDYECICNRNFWGNGEICLQIVPDIMYIDPPQAREGTTLHITLNIPIWFQPEKTFIMFGNLIVKSKGAVDSLVSVRVPKLNQTSMPLYFSFDSMNWSNPSFNFTYLGKERTHHFLLYLFILFCFVAAVSAGFAASQYNPPVVKQKPVVEDEFSDFNQDIDTYHYFDIEGAQPFTKYRFHIE
ncbi:hypothetical protein TVAG_304630 [Trichomonas vaginalis G3]|uniref:EGF-like domain-containing protein n=1 Tax=Trichomonas vaginalis (strain ATCC PRA-98 / G3) TaxID=412133 RepID=A2F2P8_TRIV3|nr:hypothetical protein TVAGG3_1020440 [Trichomonas vaginalis G3]EAY00822.1 hypothetical protein TVAG_304630 [Trichomonas vaginalis G3]KAI5492098.1 hypothetical protein TVAGG3_1020440 [Trichomonas vaginalis G3]|eukprot:XP_001313751.1 hypothetical protein [Trichomonas vaginalis G3]